MGLWELRAGRGGGINSLYLPECSQRPGGLPWERPNTLLGVAVEAGSCDCSAGTIFASLLLTRGPCGPLSTDLCSSGLDSLCAHGVLSTSPVVPVPRLPPDCFFQRLAHSWLSVVLSFLAWRFPWSQRPSCPPNVGVGGGATWSLVPLSCPPAFCLFVQLLGVCQEPLSFLCSPPPGTAIVTEEHAAMWTDGRYFLQAAKQMDSNWTLMKMGV